MVFTTDVKKKTQLGPTVVYCALVNLEDVIDVVIGDVINVIGDVIQKDLQTHLLICHPLHVSANKLKLQHERKAF